MMTSNDIIEVSEADFEFEVIAYSENIPVVVDFWAEWCAPCRVIGPILEKLALEGRGNFRLAKVNVDVNQNLARSYNIRSIPAVKAFRQGRVISEFLGALPENRIKAFIQEIAPSEDQLKLEKAFTLLQSQPMVAEKEFRQVIRTSPENPSAMLGLAKSLLIQGVGKEAYSLLKDFPASSLYSNAEILLPLAEALKSDERAVNDDNGLDAAFANAIRLSKRGNLEAAMDGFLDVLRQDKKYRNGAPRQLILAILEILGPEDPLSRQYRQELASVLF